MQAFERGARQQRAVARGAEQRGGLHQQERAQPLAAAEHRMAHGAKQPRRPHDFARQRLVCEQTAEQPFGRGGDRGKPGG